jgi:sugar lactone lactonase YvrE
MRVTLLLFLSIFALGCLFSCGTQSSSLETSLEDKKIHVINFRDFTLYLDFILGTDHNKDSGFQNPSSMALDSLKNIYVSDKGNNRIQVYSRTGKHLRTTTMKP